MRVNLVALYMSSRQSPVQKENHVLQCKETYAQIMNDINKAVERLNGTTRKHISHIDYATALGLQARIALVMEDWATAKKSSEEAIAVSKCTIAKSFRI